MGRSRKRKCDQVVAQSASTEGSLAAVECVIPMAAAEQGKRSAARNAVSHLAETQSSDPKVALALKLLGAKAGDSSATLNPIQLDAATIDRQGRRLLRGLGLAVKLHRVQWGWSQERLGSNSGLDRTYVGCIERGERNLGIANVALLARALQMSAAELLAEAERLAAQLDEDDA